MTWRQSRTTSRRIAPANAIRFIDELRAQCQRLVKAPLPYVARPELGEGLRSWPMAGMSFSFGPTPP